MNNPLQRRVLLPFLVTVSESSEGQAVTHFECQAEDAEHAKEQAVNAYPGAQILSIHDMSNFPHELVVTVDAACPQRPSIGFHYEGMEIRDPFTSACGRFIIEPAEYGLEHEHAYQLQRLNDAVSAATEVAIEQATAHLNRHLRDAGHEPLQDFFKGSCDERHAIWRSLAAYMVASLNASHRKRMGHAIAAVDAAPSIARIGAEGLKLIADERSAFPGVKGWWNAMPLPRGQVCVHGHDQVEVSPLWVESSKISIRVFDLDGKLLSTNVIDGREGLNRLYQAYIGYRPDDDSFEPDATRLLARVCEAAYRHATGDAQ